MNEYKLMIKLDYILAIFDLYYILRLPLAQKADNVSKNESKI